MPLDLSELARALVVATDASRREILPRFRHVATEWKSDASPVTEADRAAEGVLKSALHDALPEAGFLGEESGQSGDPESALQWVVDPIDGTLSYTRGIPLFATLVTLLEGGQPVLACIDLPALGERYLGWRGGGCWRGDVRVQISQESDLGAALVAHGDLYCFDRAGERDAYRALAERVPMLRAYTDAFGHAQVLSGAADAMVDLDLALWDALPAQLLVPEAGGRCVSLAYAGIDGDDKIGLVLGAPALVEQIAALLHGRAAAS